MEIKLNDAQLKPLLDAAIAKGGGSVNEEERQARARAAIEWEKREYRRQQQNLETAAGEGLGVMIALFGGKRETLPETDVQLRERIRVAAFRAAPALVRALLFIECADPRGGEDHCGCCARPWRRAAHHPDCQLDAALALCGLDTDEKRDLMRLTIAKEKGR